MENQDKAIADIKHYLEMHVQAGKTFGSGWRGAASAAKLMLDYGRGYYFNSDSFAGPRATPKMCFMNAYQLSMSSDLTYVEGYLHIGLPINHAWCVGKDGIVIDPTIEGFRDVLPAQGYFGIPFKREYVIKTAFKTGVYGILSYTNPDLMEGKLPASEFLEDSTNGNN